MPKFLSSFFPCFDFFIKKKPSCIVPKIKKGGNEDLVFPRTSFKSSFKLAHCIRHFILTSEKRIDSFFRFLKLKTFPLASRGSKEDTVIDYRPGSKLKPNYGSTHVRYCTFNRVIVSVGRVPRYTDTVVHSHPRFTP